MGQKGNKLVNNIITYAILILGTVIMLVPFIWMVLTSFKTYAETVKIPVQWLPSAWNLDNYREVLVKLDFIRYYRNTLHPSHRADAGTHDVYRLAVRIRLCQNEFPLQKPDFLYAADGFYGSGTDDHDP